MYENTWRYKVIKKFKIYRKKNRWKCWAKDVNLEEKTRGNNFVNIINRSMEKKNECEYDGNKKKKIRKKEQQLWCMEK